MTRPEPTEIFHVPEAVVSCDGGNAELGHPLVYLNITGSGEVDCPYCGRRYILKSDRHMPNFESTNPAANPAGGVGPDQ